MDTEQKRKRIEALVKVAALLVGGFLCSSFIFIAVKGLIGLLLGAAVGLTAVNLAPWFAVKVANWRLKALKHEASLNPIETLENQYKEREGALVAFRENIKSFHAEVQNFYGELEGFKERYPDKAARFDEQYGKMKMLLDARGTKYKQAQRKLLEFSEVIDQKRSEWKIGQAAAKMSKAAGQGEDFISKLMADTALDSVQTNLNIAFSELEVSLLDEVDGKKVIPMKQPVALAEGSGPPTLDLDFVTDNQSERKAK